MTVSTIKAIFESDINKVWETVTNLKDCSWRSDLSSVEILSENQFVEHDKSGYEPSLPSPAPSSLSAGSLIWKTAI